MPDALISTTTSCGPGVGSGNSANCNLRSPRKVTPRMVGLPDVAIGWFVPMIQYWKSSWGEGIVKVVSYLHQGRHGVGVVTGANGVVALAKAAPELPGDLRQILQIDPTLEKVRAATAGK